MEDREGVIRLVVGVMQTQRALAAALVALDAGAPPRESLQYGLEAQLRKLDAEAIERIPLQSVLDLVDSAPEFDPDGHKSPVDAKQLLRLIQGGKV